MTDIATNSLNQALKTLGEKLGRKEDQMGDESFAGTGIAKDAGDYGTSAEALSAQKKETYDPGAPKDSGRGGSAVQTVNTDTDKSYSLGGMDAVTAKQTIAILERATAGLTKKAQEPAGAAPSTTPAATAPGEAPAEGAEVGGAPAVDVDAGAQPPGEAPPASPGMPMTSGTDVIIQEKIVSLEDEIQSKKEVVDTLKSIANEAGVPTVAKKAPVVAKSRRQAAAEVSVKDNEPKGKVPHTMRDRESYTNKPDPDDALHSEAKEKSDGTPKARQSQVFGEGSDKDYVLARRMFNRVLMRQAGKLQKQGVKQTDAIQRLEGSRINQQWTRVEAAYRKNKVASRKYMDELAQLVKSGMSYESARAKLKQTKGGQIEGARKQLRAELEQFKPLLRTAQGTEGQREELKGYIKGQDDIRGQALTSPLAPMMYEPGNASGGLTESEGRQALRPLGRRVARRRKLGQDLTPGEAMPGGNPSEYSGADVGDRKSDEISDGNVETLVSPETNQIANQADAILDQRHNEAVAGSVVAFTKVEGKKILGVLKDLDTVHDGLVALAQGWAKQSMLTDTPARLNAALNVRVASMNRLGNDMQNLLLLSKEKRANKRKLREAMSKAVVAAQAQIKQGKDYLRLANTLSNEVVARNSRLARVAPAFKLALRMLDGGHLSLHELPDKLASFMGMNQNEFKKVAEVIAGLQPVSRAREKTAARLPLVRQSASDDPLAGMFDD